LIEDYIENYGRRLYGLCRKLCGDAYDAEDLYQETWLRVLRSFEKYNSACDFEKWAARICVNLFRDRWRRKKRSPVLDTFPSAEEKTQILENVAAPEAEDYSMVHTAVAALPEKQRVTVVLYYFNGFDTGATARILRVPEGTVKSRLAAARKRLKERLKDEELF